MQQSESVKCSELSKKNNTSNYWDFGHCPHSKMFLALILVLGGLTWIGHKWTLSRANIGGNQAVRFWDAGSNVEASSLDNVAFADENVTFDDENVEFVPSVVSLVERSGQGTFRVSSRMDEIQTRRTKRQTWTRRDRLKTFQWSKSVCGNA
jgi:hypothetical protein